MSESKHTPGPWSVKKEFYKNDEGGKEIVAFDVVSANGVHIVDEEGLLGNSDETRANANLIAAAPDLLEAARAAAAALLVYTRDSTQYEQDILLAAIKKAEGA